MDRSDELVVISPVITGSPGWQPVEGEETQQLLDRLVDNGDLPADGVAKLRRESVEVISRSINPGGSGPEVNTGLVIGRIQSGKTMSFTTVVALARDNGFDLVLIMGGTTRILIDQTRGRLTRDLNLTEGRAFLRWDAHESILSVDRQGRLRRSLNSARDPSSSPTVVVTLMKHHDHINSVTEALSEVDTRELSALIIDDEADQYSLNTAIADNDESTTYRAIRRLRAALPRHTYLQYTATPQAPLLIDLADVLSPDWTAILRPGNNYTGGQTFFRDRQAELIRAIPAAEAHAITGGTIEPPGSFVHSLYVYLLSFAAGHLQYAPDGPDTRSMMIHPDRLVWSHDLVAGWVDETRDRLEFQLGAAVGTPEHIDLIEDLEPAYDELSSTTDLPPLDELMNRLRNQIGTLRVQRVNSTEDALEQSLRWHEAYGWILIGGDMLGRGFTVKGLTTTYMTRSAGVGNADTMAQRARFFGYRGSYLEFCRVWLTVDVIDAYRSLVETEEMIRADLEDHMGQGRSLKDWRRRFLMDPALRPTRDSVVAIGLYNARLGRWVTQRYTAMPQEIIDGNRTLVDRIRAEQSFEPIPHDDPWGANQNHAYSFTRLQDTQASLLIDWGAVAQDRQAVDVVNFAVSEIVRRDPEAVAELHLINSWEPRERTATEKDSENNPRTNLMQGPSDEDAELAYPGDRGIHESTQTIAPGQRVVIQLHRINVDYAVPGLPSQPDRQLDVPMLAVLIPEGTEHWIVEPGRG